jgi:hypothetical protein
MVPTVYPILAPLVLHVGPPLHLAPQLHQGLTAKAKLRSSVQQVQNVLVAQLPQACVILALILSLNPPHAHSVPLVRTLLQVARPRRHVMETASQQVEATALKELPLLKAFCVLQVRIVLVQHLHP